MTVGAYSRHRSFGVGTGNILENPPPGDGLDRAAMTEIVAVFGQNRRYPLQMGVVAYYVTLENWVTNVRNWYERREQ